MRRFKLLLALACICLAFVTGATVSAFAGINTNNPGGAGLIENGELNMESFILNEEAEDSAYSLQMGNSTVYAEGIAWRGMFFGAKNAIPAADLVEGTKITVQFDVYQFGAMWTQCFYFAPFSPRMDLAANYLPMRINTAGPHFLANVEGATVSVQGGEPASMILNNQTVNWGFQGSVLTEQKQKGNDYATFWFEYDVTELTLTVYAGNRESGEKTMYSVTKNMFTIPAADQYYMVYALDNTMEFDNWKVYGETNGSTKVYADIDFNEPEDIGNDFAALDQNGFFANKGVRKSYDNKIVVTNPAADASINSINPLKVDTRLATTFDLTTTFAFNSMVETRKVGVAFGLDNYDTALSAPADGASFVYFTVDAEGKLVLGADNIAADGTATAAGETYTLADVALGDKVVVEFYGQPDNSVKVLVNSAEYSFPGLKLNGHISFAQTGTGAVSYDIYPDEFAVTGYYLTENEGEAETATFDANYISASKFATQFTIAPSEYVKKQDTTVGEIDGLTTDGGRLNFRGTSTHSRVTFNKPYADFVFQFDYISEPYATRAIPGGLETAGQANRYSPFYVIFGSEQTISELKLTYALGIVDGNPTQYFWGAESMLISEGKLGNGTATVLATGEEVPAGTENAITAYRSNGEGGFAPYSMLPRADAKYSFYNKTTRCKLVVINNNVAFYVATVAEDGTVGDYILAYTAKVANSFGYVGFGTDAPGWASVDNVAITPIAKETAIELGLNAVPAVDLVADVAVADMETDNEPTPIAKTNITVDAEAKKLSWTAVEGAKEYAIVVSLNKEAIIEKTVNSAEALELDLSTLTTYGTYDIVVTTVPENEDLYLKSRATSTYTIEAPADSGSEGGDVEQPKGCFASVSVFGIGAIVLVAGVMLAKKKED